jgi:hypothetical protein
MPCLLCLLCQVSSPMDLATILSRVDAQQYSTPQEYLADFGLIVQVGTVGRGCSVCASPNCGLRLERFHSWSIPVSPAHPLPPAFPAAVLPRVLGHQPRGGARDQPRLRPAGRGARSSGQRCAARAAGSPGGAVGAGRPRAGTPK